jgi:phage shock protein E
MSEFIDPQVVLEAKKSDVTVIDVRSPEEYAKGHVPGAVNIPIDELESRRSELGEQRLLVPYCNMLHPGSSRGEKATALLKNLGFEAKALQGGFVAWQAEGLPVEETK